MSRMSDSNLTSAWKQEECEWKCHQIEWRTCISKICHAGDEKLSVTEAKLDSATTNVQDMLFVKQIIKSMGLKVKIPMVLQVDNQGVRELVNNWSVGGHTCHGATKAMFLGKESDLR
jgi:hypothetical protein